MNRRRLLFTLAAAGAASAVAVPWYMRRHLRNGASAAVAPEDWNAYLNEWHRRACDSVAQWLYTYGIGGSAQTGIAEFVQAQASAAGVHLESELLRPLPRSSDDDSANALAEGLRRLNALASQVDVRYVLSYEWTVIRNQGIKSAPVGEDELGRVEARLGEKLPDSFKAFLRVSNGWITTSSRLLPCDQVQRFGTKDPAYVKDWSHDVPGGVPDSEYYVYGKRQLPYNIRPQYLKDCLLLSEGLLQTNERLLLNPHVRFNEGEEWESWLMSPSLPGAIRYQSFFELLESLRQSDIQQWKQALA